MRQFDFEKGETLQRVIQPQQLRSFHVLPETPCPYLAGQVERKLLTQISGDDAVARYDLLSRAGFRRSHSFAYRPACEACQACVAVRVPAEAFRPSQSLKRVAGRNGDLQVTVTAALGTAEHFTLFARYIAARHGDGEMSEMSYDDYLSMVEGSGLNTFIAEFRDGDGKLLAACLMDWLSDGASAVYSYFDPGEAERSLGIYMVLWLIDAVKERGLPYLYLGYWIAASTKMAYKVRFRPIELLTAEGWHRYAAGEGPKPAANSE